MESVTALNFMQVCDALRVHAKDVTDSAVPLSLFGRAGIIDQLRDSSSKLVLISQETTKTLSSGDALAAHHESKVHRDKPRGLG